MLSAAALRVAAAAAALRLRSSSSSAALLLLTHLAAEFASVQAAQPAGRPVQGPAAAKRTRAGGGLRGARVAAEGDAGGGTGSSARCC